MTPSNHSQHCSKPLIIEKNDQDHIQLHDPFALATEAPPFPFPHLLNAPQDQEYHHSQQQLLLQQPEMIGETSYRSVPSATNYYSYDDHATINRSMYDPHVRDGDQQQGSAGEWMSSKMRIMRKMLKTEGIITSKRRVAQQEDQQRPNHQESSSRNNISISPSTGIIRVCSDCNTTKTPLWRSGPSGPKSLCNACGIRQRKARRAMAAAAALGGGLVPAETKIKVPKDHKRSDIDRTVPFKKRCRFSTAGTSDHHDQKQPRFEDTTINMGKSSAMHRVFPQDERDAAILLMALSCGIIRR